VGPGQQAGPGGRRVGSGAIAGTNVDGQSPDDGYAGDGPRAIDAPPGDAPQRNDGAADGRIADAAAPDSHPADAAATDANDPCATGGTCGSLTTMYSAAVARARVCRTGVVTTPAQCSFMVRATPACGCMTWVNSDTEIRTLQGKWTEAGCDRCKVTCPACVKLSSGYCQGLRTPPPPTPVAAIQSAANIAGTEAIAPVPIATGTCVDRSIASTD